MPTKGDLQLTAYLVIGNVKRIHMHWICLVARSGYSAWNSGLQRYHLGRL